MFELVLLGLVASASTAPWFDLHDYNKGFQESMDRFWENFNRKMHNFDHKIQNIVKHSKNRASRSRIDGDEYKISIYLPGFNNEDIVVKVKNENLVIQAIHNEPGEPANNYLYVRGLPDFVDKKGIWFYKNGILKIVFPIIQLKNDDNSEDTIQPSENDVEY